VRIVSLLPSATEIVYALDLEDALVGVTHECNWPPGARTKTRVSRTLLPVGASPAEIDALVSEANVEGGTPTEVLDEAVLAELSPDLILTQDLCAVCAIPAGHVEAALNMLGCHAEVVSLDPGTVGEMLDGIRRVGQATGREQEAERLVGALEARVEAVRTAVSARARRRVFALEWGDPPYNAGHWIPEMIEIAGGDPLLAEPRRDSVRVMWSQIEELHPDVVVFTPCGYSLVEAVEEGRTLLGRRELAGAEVWAVDADSFFVRPGPRLVDGIEILAGILHPDIVGEPPAAGALRLDV
jgi:iron complex transport system substrate-binding protein